MVSYEKDLFEVEENYFEFQDVCASLKSHPFPSPWKMFFKQTFKDAFVSEVSEFVIDANEIQDSTKVASSHDDDMLLDEQTDISKSQLVSASIPINKVVIIQYLIRLFWTFLLEGYQCQMYANSIPVIFIGKLKGFFTTLHKNVGVTNAKLEKWFLYVLNVTHYLNMEN